MSSQTSFGKAFFILHNVGLVLMLAFVSFIEFGRYSSKGHSDSIDREWQALILFMSAYLAQSFWRRIVMKKYTSSTNFNDREAVQAANLTATTVPNAKMTEPGFAEGMETPLKISRVFVRVLVWAVVLYVMSPILYFIFALIFLNDGKRWG